MEQQDLKPGDKIFHKSLNKVIWVIDKIENDEAYCSTVMQETLEKKTQIFSIISIVKIDENRPAIFTGEYSNRNRF